MQRSLYLSLVQEPLLLQQLAHRRLAIAPTPQAARTLQAPHQSLETLAQNLVRDRGLAVASPLQVYQTLQRAVREVMGSSVEGITRVTPALKAILRVGADLNALKAFNSERVQQLAHLAEVYQLKLRASSLIDPAEIFWQATRLQPPQPILLYGYLHPYIDELAFLNAIAGDRSIIILPCGNADIFTSNREAVGWLQQRGWIVEEDTALKSTSCLSEQLPDCFLNRTAVSAGVSAHVYPNLEAEVRGVLAQVKKLLHEGVAADEIVLVAGDEAVYGPLLIDIAWEYDLPVQALYDVSLLETRLGGWVQLLLEVIRDNFPFEPTAKLLNHSLTGLSAEVWAEARQRHPNGRNDWQKLGVDLSPLSWSKRDSRAGWVQRLQDLLNQLQQRIQCWAREAIAFERVQEALVDLAKPDEQINLEDFIKEAIDALALLSVPAQPNWGGVELHRPLSLFGARYQHVFVLGAVEGILPALVENDPGLDFHERKQLVKQGFPFETAVRVAQREALSFWALLQVATTSLTFSYPRLIGKEPSLPTPYLKRLGLEATAPSLLPLASWEEVRRLYLRRDDLPDVRSDSVFANAVRNLAVEQRRESTAPADEYDGVVGLPIDPATRVFSASQLTALGQCPFKWFAQRVLRLQELPEAETDLGFALRGQLYHRSLELALTSVKSAADLHLVGREQLQMAFLQAEQDLEFPALAAWDVRRVECINILSRNLASPAFLPSGVEIVRQEAEFDVQWYGFRVKGRVDRIDRTATGLALLDYKTSSTAPPGVKNEFGKAQLDIQLPIYQDAVAKLFPNESATDAYYYSLTKYKRLSTPKRDDTALAAFTERVKFYLEGHYPVAPDVDQKACQSCPFDSVCRQGTRLSRKQQEMQK